MLTHIAQVAGPLGTRSVRWEIFGMLGITDMMKGDDTALMGHLGDAVEGVEDGILVFANFVEFDSLYGHRRGPRGCARASGGSTLG